jgi:hypothetical protein
MNKIKANALKKLLDETMWFSAVAVKSAVKDKWALVVRETINDRPNTNLSRYYWMNAFCTIHQQGMIIEANGSIPNYYIY